MGLFSWLKPRKTSSDPIAALLDAYLASRAANYHFSERVGEHPEGSAILESPPETQVAVIHAAFDRLRGLAPGPTDDWTRRWLLSKLLKALLRRRQPFTDADILLLLRRLVASGDPFGYSMPGLEVLRTVSAHAGRHGLPEGTPELLIRLRTAVLKAQDATVRRKATELFDTLLGPERQQDTADPDEVEEDRGDPIALRAEAEALIAAYVQEALAHPDAERSLDPRQLYHRMRTNAARPGPSDVPAGRRLLESSPPFSTAVFETAAARYLDSCEHDRGWDRQRLEAWAVSALMNVLVKQPPLLSPAGIRRILPQLAGDQRAWLHMWSVRPVLVAVLNQVEERRLMPRIRAELEALRAAGDAHTGRYAVREVVVYLDELLAGDRRGPVEAVDAWGRAAQAALERLDPAACEPWRGLLVHARTSSGSKPSAKWLARARPLLEAVGEDAFRARLVEWLGFLRLTPPPSPDQDRPPISPLTLTESNLALLKGLVWSAPLVDVEPIAADLAEAAAQCFKKVPGSGPRAISVGNACIQALGTVRGIQGVQRLQWLRHRVVYIPALKQIDAQLEQAAGRVGLERDDLEELLVPTFGLVEGRRREALGDYAAELVVGPRDGVELRWSKADGTALRSEPAAVKREFGEERKALRATVDELRKIVPTQRGRIERLLLADRSWRLGDWRERYLDHGLLDQLARRLIWWFGVGEAARAGCWLDGRLVDAADRPLDGLADDTPVRLWHPVGVAPAAVLAWREWLERHEVTQPFKQAHREVYLLTDAELRTATYSNRFAAHILRQHQMHALAQQRGWKAPLAMVYDGGWDSTLTLALPRWGLRAEYFVQCALGDVDGGYNDNGVCLYVATDQVRFRRLPDGEPVPLVDVPALVFTEALRDVDLFVGVASVGNDPTWLDRGPAGHQAYWQSYAFGELGESAKTRRAALERLLPRLTKLAGRWSLAERFLVIRGDLRTYKIHLGSGNILMEPNDQYLCIVPGRGDAQVGEGRLFLPFEGDPVLAVILSKAFLLADDARIEDPSIRSQIASDR